MPERVARGWPSTLTWVTKNAGEVAIEGVGVVLASGSLSVTPHSTTTYRLVASKDGGQISTDATVRVDEPLAVELQLSPPNGVVPFRSTMVSVVSGGTPPYTFIWSTGENGQRVERTWRVAGSHEVYCRVMDAVGNQSSSPVRIVAASAPSADFDFRVVDELNPKVERIGAVADGASRVKLIATSTVPGLVTFVMTSTIGVGPDDDGGLR
ncbi:MAG: hypothetical protein LC667_09625, partial [Thioalkalivibrio sp.]|nr:hypothetical protein [Thioalkalivibrio sp.]